MNDRDYGHMVFVCYKGGKEGVNGYTGEVKGSWVRIGIMGELYEE